MSAQPQDVVVPLQGELFTVEITKPTEGAITLAHTREVPLPHDQTAELLKRASLGDGSVVSFTGGTGRINGFRHKGGRLTWTVDVEDFEIEL